MTQSHDLRLGTGLLEEVGKAIMTAGSGDEHTMRAESFDLCGRFVQLKNVASRSRTLSKRPCTDSSNRQTLHDPQS